MTAAAALLLAGNLLHLRVNEPHEPVDAVFSRAAWNGSLDGSHVETLGYAQLVLAVVVLARRGYAARAGLGAGTAVSAAWALVLAAVVADDALRLHERLGAVVVRRLGLEATAGLRAGDLGELSVWAVGAAVLLPVLWCVTGARLAPTAGSPPSCSGCWRPWWCSPSSSTWPTSSSGRRTSPDSTWR